VGVREKLVKDFPGRPEYLQALAFGHAELARLLQELQQPGPAKAYHLKALAARTQLAEKYPAVVAYRHDLAFSHYALGTLEAATGEHEAAQQSYRQAITLWQRLVEEVPNSPEYRHSLARAHYSLGNVLRQTGEAAEAEEAYGAALPPQRALAKEFPAVPNYRSDLGATLNNLSLALLGRGAAAEARPLLEEALGHQRAARQADPRHPTYRRYLRNHHAVLADALLRLGEHAGVVENAVQLPALYPKDWKEAHRAANFVANCVNLARKDAALSPEKSAELAQAYGDQAVRLLSQAVESGLTDVQLLTADPAFEPLQSRADFQALLKKLKLKRT
jgi:eukaryotic-like serine/threonine-protein kinase